MPISKVEHQRRLELGLCIRCGTQPASPNRQQCDICRAYVNSVYKRSTAPKRSMLRKQRTIIGLCRCGQAARPEYTNCIRCADYQNKSVKKRADLAITNGICTKCKTCEAAVFHRLCANCQNVMKHRQRENRKRWIELGLCKSYGRHPAQTNHTACAGCRQRQVERYHKLKLAAFMAYGGAHCNCCGETTFEFLTIDHIGGGGNRHRRVIGSGILVWLKHRNYPKGFQVLCMNCNLGCGDGKECPHRKQALPPFTFIA